MNCFFDTSALIKKYIAEKGSDLVSDYLKRANLISVSATTRVECFSVLTRMVANDDLSKKDAVRLKAEIFEDFLFFSVIPFNEPTESLALDIVQKHRLRTLDSIQLASELVTKQLPEYFFGADDKLNDCAKLE
ncbi:MAG: type II toxin-antitoxin system VapC family toxin, partial [Cytophagales bacterium]